MVPSQRAHDYRDVEVMHKSIAKEFSRHLVVDFKYFLDVFKNIFDVLDVVKELIELDRIGLYLLGWLMSHFWQSTFEHCRFGGA